MLRALLLRLVTPGPDGQPVRSRLPRRTVVTGPESDALIDLLISSRLVTSDDGVVELAHEALARAWPRLRGWLEDDLEGQQILHHLTQVADSWESLGRPESELYRGVRLAKALQWQQDSNARPDARRRPTSSPRAKRLSPRNSTPPKTAPASRSGSTAASAPRWPRPRSCWSEP